METKRFIQVILPLKLGWEPFYGVPQGMELAVGDRVLAGLGTKTYHAVVSSTEGVSSIEPSRIRDIICKEEDLPSVSASQIDFWRFISGYYMCSVGEVFAAAYPEKRMVAEKASARLRRREEASKARTDAAIERLQHRIAIRKERLGKARLESVKERLIAEIEELSAKLSSFDVPEAPPEPSGEDIILSQAQQKAASQIKQAFSQGKNTLLCAVAGAGKTEIYLHLAREVLEKGRNVLYLTPEIAMGMQLSDRIKSIFPSLLLTCNSSDSAAARRVTQDRMRQGQYLLFGTRSSIFLPHHDLGLVVIDEEHDSSYKQDNPSPRYNGRDCAVMLAAMHGCPVLLGSATPSLESLYNCGTGKYEKVDLGQKYYGNGLDRVEIIDTRAEFRKNGMKGSFSRRLISRIESTLSVGQQVLILRERRSYSPAVQCTVCGEIPHCPNCNVALSYHLDRAALLCHYCGYSEAFTGSCAKCGGTLRPLGAGTQKIEEEAQALFPGARIGRLEGDTPPAQASQIVEALRDGKLDMLIGTRVIAKGFDFGSLGLTAVIQADSMLATDDFRADEKAFQTLMQLMGRSGRRGGDSALVIQTAQPGHPVYEALKSGSDTSAVQLSERKLFGYPPFTRVIGLSLRDKDEKALEEKAGVLCSLLSSPAQVRGPFAPAVDKVAGLYIRQIRLTLPRDRSLALRKSSIGRIVEKFSRENNIRLSIDVDPV
ncbi:MAG: primosomal protein N' [Bacteroidales bacterium]|nr:primosomal protein N' [Bacteroidales bacterium]